MKGNIIRSVVTDMQNNKFIRVVVYVVLQLLLYFISWKVYYIVLNKHIRHDISYGISLQLYTYAYIFLSFLLSICLTYFKRRKFLFVIVCSLVFICMQPFDIHPYKSVFISCIVVVSFVVTWYIDILSSRNSVDR